MPSPLSSNPKYFFICPEMPLQSYFLFHWENWSNKKRFSNDSPPPHVPTSICHHIFCLPICYSYCQASFLCETRWTCDILLRQGHCLSNYLSLIHQYFSLYWITPTSAYCNSAPFSLKYFLHLATSLLHSISFPITILVYLSLFCSLLLSNFNQSWDASNLAIGRAQNICLSLSICMYFAISPNIMVLNFIYMLTSHRITISGHSCALNTSATSLLRCPIDLKVNVLRLPD